MSPTRQARHERRVNRAWSITRVILLVGAFVIVVALGGALRANQVQQCESRADLVDGAREARKVQREFMRTAAIARLAAYARDRHPIDQQTARNYFNLIKRTPVPDRISCPTFWSN